MYSFCNSVTSEAPKPKSVCRLLAAVSVSALSANLALVANAEDLGEVRSISIQSTTLSSALVEMSRETGVPIFAPSDITDGVQVRSVVGDYSVSDALSVLLIDTGLVAHKNDNGMFVLARQPLVVEAKSAAPISPVRSQAVSAPAPSAELNAQETEFKQDVVVVTGIAGQNRASIQSKVASDAVAEFLFADEIGQFPDYNISDAIRRVSGVNTIFDEDEGRYIALRGLDADFTYTSIDGASIAALDLGGDLGGGRRVLLEAVPSFAVAETQIYKTVSAERDGQGVGGQVNLVTRSAYDRDELFFTARGSVGYYDSTGYPTSDNGPSVRADAAYSNIFGSNNEFGVVLSASYMLKDRDQDRFSPGSYTYRGADTVPVSDPETDPYVFASPGFIVQRGYKNKIQRYGGLIKFEHRPSAQFYQSLSAQYYTQTDDEERTGTYPNAGSVTSFDGENYSVEGADATSRVQFWDIDKWVSNTHYRMAYDHTDDLSLSFQANYSQSGWQEYVPRTAFFTRRTIDYLARPGDSDQGVSFVIEDPNSDYFNIDAFNRFDARLREDDEREEVWETRGSVEYNAAKDDSGLGFRGGFTLRRTERDFDRDQYRYRQGTDFNLTLADYLLDADFKPVQASYPIYVHNSPKLFSEVLAENDGNAGQFRLDEAWSEPRSRASDFLVREDLFAIFGQVIHEGEKHRLEAGLRLEHTDVFARANQDTTTVVIDGTGNATTVNTEGKIDREGQYMKALPSFAFIYDIQKGLRVRTGFSETLGRPSYRSISGTVVENFNEVTGITSITEGNPDLDPRISRNYDVELVWYAPDNNTLVSIGAFYKDIRNDIFVRTTTSSDGSLIVTRPENVETSSIKGIEFSLIKNSFDFLPEPFNALGINLNATLLEADVSVDDETSFDYRLEQPEFLLNTSLFYRRGPFEGRITYNRTGEQPRTVDVGTPYLSTWEQTYEQVDANLDFEISDHWKLRLQGRNLTDEPRIINEGPDQSQIWDYSQFGAQYWVGVTYRH